MSRLKANSPAIKVPCVDLRAPDAVAQFRGAAAASTRILRASSNPSKAARALFVKEGILTPSGKLSRHYR
ncbi:MAG: hypothetical protein ACYCSN_14410 [Acidobacteriaceae bacterium]